MADFSEDEYELSFFNSSHHISDHDVESLCDSDREELENSLYSQIYFEQSVVGSNLLFDSSEQQFIPTTADTHANIVDTYNKPLGGEINTQLSVKNNKLFEVKKNKLRKAANKLLQSTELVSKKDTNRKQTKDLSSVKFTTEVVTSSYDSRPKSKYGLKQKKETSNNVKRNTKVALSQDNTKRNDERLSDDESIHLSDGVVGNSDISSCDSFTSFYDSDSSSMCCKIFDKETSNRPHDIQLNISVRDEVNKNEVSDDEEDSIVILSSSSDESDDEDKWRISEQDVLGSQPESFRYYKYDALKHIHCKNCRETGHLSRDCPKPKVIVCYLCGKKGHWSQLCPDTVCYNCSKPGHISADCKAPQYKWFIKCTRCDMPGHEEENCPDLWRRFHLTTKEGELVRRPVQKNPRTFCCNCASNKHFAFNCNKPPMSTHAQMSCPFIISYKPLSKHYKNKKSNKTYFTDDPIEPVYKKRKVQIISHKEKEKQKRNQKKVSVNAGFLTLDPLKNFKKIMNSYKKEKKGKNNTKKKKRSEKKKEHLHQKYSSFVNSATTMSNNDKLFLYADKKLTRKNKLKVRKKKKNKNCTDIKPKVKTRKSKKLKS